MTASSAARWPTGRRAGDSVDGPAWPAGDPGRPGRLRRTAEHRHRRAERTQGSRPGGSTGATPGSTSGCAGASSPGPTAPWQPFRSPGGHRCFTNDMLRDVAPCRHRHGRFSLAELRSVLVDPALDADWEVVTERSGEGLVNARSPVSRGLAQPLGVPDDHGAVVAFPSMPLPNGAFPDQAMGDP